MPLPRPDRRFLVVALTAGLLACTAAQRRDRLDLTVSGASHQATAADFGCGGDLILASRQRQTAGAAGVRAQWSNGVEVDAEAAVVANRVEATAGNTSDRPGDRYILAAARGRLGIRSSLIGADLGGSTHYHDGDVLPFPLLAGHVGLIDKLWVEGRIGSRDLLLDSNVVGMYLHAQYGEQGGVSVGFGGAARPMVVRPTGGGPLLRMSELNDTVQVEAWVQLPGVSLRASARVGDRDSGAAVQVRLPLAIGPAPRPIDPAPRPARLPEAASATAY